MWYAKLHRKHCWVSDKPFRWYLIGKLLIFANYTAALLRALAISPCKHWIMRCCSCWPSAGPERRSGWKAEVRLSVLRENWQEKQVFRELDILRNWFYELNSCVSLSRKPLKCFTVITISRDCRSFMRLVETFWKTSAWLHELPFTKITYILTCLCLFGAVSQSHLRLSPAAVLTLPPINLGSQLSGGTFF